MVVACIAIVLTFGCFAAANEIPIYTASFSTFDLLAPRIDSPQTQQGLLPLPGKCECVKNACGCCALYDISPLNFNHTGCLNFTYFPSDFAIQLNLLLSNVSIFNARVSGKNPPALCIPLPQLPILSLCIKLYDIHTDEQNLHSCLNMELRFNDWPLVVISFDCAQLGPAGVIFYKPTPPTPSDNGQWDLNFSLSGLANSTQS
ncbi:uncharacterized protein LOC135945306 [Cloeon dipterum]|uniref:uncharacterized protein LOC135945306 n=1 Tax=Cloeon dipterum TaxID=197152 RepID=UPI00322060FC